MNGIMIGRGIFQNPWIFNPKVDILRITPKQREQLLLDHIKIFQNVWGDKKDFNIMKKFFKAYIRDYPGALKLRAKLMKAKNIKEINMTS